jgi:hypothetical protein
MTRTHSGYSTRGKGRFERITKIQDDWMLRAVKTLNVIEKYLGWSLSTVLKDTSEEVTDKTVRANVYVFNASAKWLRAPQLMSLYLLIIRLSATKALYRATSVTELMEKLSKLDYDKLVGNEKVDFREEDDTYAQGLSYYLQPLLDHVGELFFKRNIYKNYKEQNGCCGVNGLLENKTFGGDEYIKRKFAELVNSKV